MARGNGGRGRIVTDSGGSTGDIGPRHTRSFDIKKERRDLYAPRAGCFVEVDVPRLRFLMADGHGDPNTAPVYREVVEALYTLSYACRAVAKAELGRVHTVGPLEGLWSAEDPAAFRTRDKDAWDWTMLVVQPDWITPEVFAAGRKRCAERDLAAAHRVRLADLDEGLSVQTLHIGPYDDEGPVLRRLHEEHLPAHGRVPTGPHHEIYLSDPRRTDPSRLRTILRQPVAPARIAASSE
nr:GyrI-like domain-containing protein [Nakamurella flavida]